SFEARRAWQCLILPAAGLSPRGPCPAPWGGSLVSDPVQDFLCRDLIAADGGDRDRFRLERSERLKGGVVGLDRTDGGPLVVAGGEILLRLVAGEVFEE